MNLVISPWKFSTKFFVLSVVKDSMVAMSSQIMSSKSRQAGFTMVEIVAVTVIVVILAAYAVPRMMGPGEFAVRTAADRLVAALHYAQTLAQRRGVETKVEISTQIKVIQGVTPVSFPSETGNTYVVDIHSDVTITPTGTLTFDSNGVPNVGGVAKIYDVNENGVKRYTVTVQPTGFVQLGS